MADSKRYAQWALTIGQIVVSVGLVGYLVSSVDWSRVGDVLPTLRREHLWQPPVFIVLSLVFASIRWTVLLTRFGIPLRIRDACLMNYVSRLYSLVLPGVIGGEVIRIALCARRTEKRLVDVAVTTLLERGLGVLALLTIGSIALSFDSANAPATISAAGPKFVFATITAFVVMAAFWRMGPFGWIANSRLRWLQRLGRIMQLLRQLTLGHLGSALALSVVSQACEVLATYHLARAIGIQLPAQVYFAILPIVFLATLLPISLGGLGVREGTLAFLLLQFGVATSDSVLLAFAIYLVRMATMLPASAAQWLDPTLRLSDGWLRQKKTKT